MDNDMDNDMDRDTGRDIVFAVIKADRKISRLLVKTLKYDIISKSDHVFEKEILKAVMESIKINHSIIWNIIEKFPDIEIEVEKHFDQKNLEKDFFS